MTRTSSYTSLLCLLLTLTLGSCSAEEEVTPLTEDTFCEQWANVACSTETVSRCEAASPTACQGSQAAFCSTLLSGTFDDQNASGCLDAVERAYTDGDLDGAEMKVVLRMEGACGQLTRGTAGEGDSCSVDKNCDAPSGFQCVLKGVEATGTCQEVSAIVGGGDNCADSDIVCEAGRYCDGTNCLTTKDIGTSCTVNRECTEGAFCSSGSCVAKLGVSTECTDDLECAEGICFDFGADGRRCSARANLTRTDPLCDNLR